MKENFHPAKAAGKVVIPSSKIGESQKWVSGEALLKAKGLKPTNLWKPFFEHYGLAILTGPSDTGKTRLVRQLSVAIVQNQETFLEFPLNVKHRRVYYVATEDNMIAVKQQLEREAGTEWRPESLSGLLFLFDSENLVEELRDKLSFMPADMIVLDSWSDGFDGNANEFTAIRKNLHPLKKLSEEFGCLMVLIHHNSKNSEKYSPDKNRLNGSQALEAKPRVVLEFREGEKENERLLTVVKHNYLPKESKDTSYVIIIEGERVLLRNSGRTINRKQIGDHSKIKFDPTIWIPRLNEVKKNKDISFTKAQEELAKKYSQVEVPSSTWFKTNYKNLDGQSNSIKADRPEQGTESINSNKSSNEE